MAQTTEIKLEYLMTLHADLDPPQPIDTASLIFNVRGGWVEGPKIKANSSLLPPTGYRYFPPVCGVSTCVER